MKFYDVPDAYDLFFSENFYVECMNFYKEIFAKKKYKDFYDCAVGTGQMLIPLAKMGFNTTGSDINVNMIKKAKLNFAGKNLISNLQVCDFRSIKEKIKREFDCVMCTGNSIGHIKNEELIDVLASMDSVLRPGGMIYIDSKNWDSVLQRKQRFYLFNPLVRDRGRVNYIQVWDYQKDNSILFNYLIFEEIENKIVSKRQFYEIYYPFAISLLLEGLKELNYQNIKICKLGDVNQTDIEKIDWYSITAEKPIDEDVPDIKERERF
jgi:ubiquinone/menaquinone biosynthesis C-methylase UbiE